MDRAFRETPLEPLDTFPERARPAVRKAWDQAFPAFNKAHDQVVEIATERGCLDAFAPLLKTFQEKLACLPARQTHGLRPGLPNPSVRGLSPEPYIYEIREALSELESMKVALKAKSRGRGQPKSRRDSASKRSGAKEHAGSQKASGSADQVMPGPAEIAFGAATASVRALRSIALHVRNDGSYADKPGSWKGLGVYIAHAFVAWHTLAHDLLTAEVREAARRTYPPGSPAIVIGRMKAKPTVIEVVADELGRALHRKLYDGKASPLDPDANAVWKRSNSIKSAERDQWIAEELSRQRQAIKSRGDPVALVVKEWERRDPASAERRLASLRFPDVDFDELQILLGREATAALAAEGTLGRAANPLSAEALSDLGSIIAEQLADRGAKTMTRPVPVAKAAVPAGKRPDVLLKMLRVRHHPIAGVKSAYLAELDHIIATVPTRAKTIRKWADKEFPLE